MLTGSRLGKLSMNLPQGEAGKRRSLDRRANRVGHLCCVGRAKLTASEIDLVRDELAYDGLFIKTYMLFEPDHAVKARTTERVTE